MIGIDASCRKGPRAFLRTLLEYCLCLPGTNALVERVFSLMNKIWTAEKAQLKVATLKAMLVLKVNACMTCKQYFGHLCTKENLLKKKHSSQKYQKY